MATGESIHTDKHPRVNTAVISKSRLRCHSRRASWSFHRWKRERSLKERGVRYQRVGWYEGFMSIGLAVVRKNPNPMLRATLFPIISQLKLGKIPDPWAVRPLSQFGKANSQRYTLTIAFVFVCGVFLSIVIYSVTHCSSNKAEYYFQVY